MRTVSLSRVYSSALKKGRGLFVTHKCNRGLVRAVEILLLYKQNLLHFFAKSSRCGIDDVDFTRGASSRVNVRVRWWDRHIGRGGSLPGGMRLSYI